MKTTMTVGRSSENGVRFAGGHFAGGHDGKANLCKPITAYHFHVRYNNIYYTLNLFCCIQDRCVMNTIPTGLVNHVAQRVKVSIFDFRHFLPH